MLVSVPPEDLARVLMPAFLDGNDLSEAKLVRWLHREYPDAADGDTAWLERPVREALQVLEHAELIYLSRWSDSPPQWRVTRLGVLCLNEGEDSVRQCIEDRIAPPRPPAAEREQAVDEL
jgi:hypothetical protein